MLQTNRSSQIEARIAPEALAVVKRAVAFYAHHGFTAFASAPKHLFLPLANGDKSCQKITWTPGLWLGVETFGGADLGLRTAKAAVIFHDRRAFLECG